MTREEAIETIKKVLPMSKTLEDAFYTLHPELCESEDERIRKEIVDFIQWAEDRGMTRHDYHQAKRPAVWIAYLEKQKEDYSDMTQLERYISEARAKKGFYWNNKEVSWEEIPLEERKHDYPYYFKNGLDCYPFVVEPKQSEC